MYLHYQVILPILFVFLIGCSNPLEYEVANLTSPQRITLRQMLTADQLKLLDDWIIRNGTDGKALPPSITVRQALTDQDEWRADRQSGKINADERQKKLLAEKAAKQKEIAKVISVSIMSKKNIVRVDEESVVSIDIAYANLSEKNIQEVTGVLKIADVYGNNIINFNCEFSSGIIAKGTVIETYPDISVKKLVGNQAELWNTDFERLISTFDARFIVFNDGTSLRAPDSD